VPRFPEWDWYFVYTREAHPGEYLPAHASMQDKLAAAGRLRDEIGIQRPILVDDLEGSFHRAYGLLPNMTWVLARGGTNLYKGMWTSAARIADALTRLEAQPLDLSHAPFFTEQLELRRRDPAEFTRGLERNGPRAVAEFARAEEIWAERARTAARARRRS
jgi:hypothetical protein